MLQVAVGQILIAEGLEFQTNLRNMLVRGASRDVSLELGRLTSCGQLFGSEGERAFVPQGRRTSPDWSVGKKLKAILPNTEAVCWAGSRLYIGHEYILQVICAWRWEGG